MKLSSLIFAIVIVLFTFAPAQAERSVRLITIGPGDAVWEKFGHNMIEIAGEPGYREDVSFNWGLFDFEQPHFIARFIQGRMLYTMRPIRSGPILDEYRGQNRSILVQELNLTPEQTGRLIQLLEINRQPANRDYRYDYFKDNCSTRVRDMLDRATGGELKRLLDDTKTPTPMTYRDHSLRLMHESLWLSLGVDFALGPSCDRVLGAWEEAFLPGRLSQSIEPMVKTSSSPWQATRPPEPTLVPDRRLPMLLAGMLLAGAMFALAWTDRIGFRRVGSGLASAWWGISAIGGSFLLFLWLFTDHTAAYANQNLLQFSPLALVVLIAWVVARRRMPRQQPTGGFAVQPPSDADRSRPAADGTLARAYPRPRFLVGVLMLIVGVSLLGFILKITTLFAQSNLNFIAFALPLNVAAALTVMRSVGLLKK